ncbi:hypothetical protein AMAG_03752 [Allomyces macrogynus ATCC 38327]|uniref:SET domain-containing protein n=1 Tax=Allomyces macrogynus (strain ATCC 38327) TaxID=578462 RepID=A0A0L0SAI5_ALLM3|nr:hypothetical protein AMAG_03752 [Allomyces macrogynus ATCC 38327]|eukprot:KNE59476.1 hypothetical protein AMAG_03752 [Allomyces macrogynus ATCC 38327]
MTFWDRFVPVAAARLAWQHLQNVRRAPNTQVGVPAGRSDSNHDPRPNQPGVVTIPPAINLYDQLHTLFDALWTAHPGPRSPLAVTRIRAATQSTIGGIPTRIVSRVLPDGKAGTGVAWAGRPIDAGRIVALYPGTLYGMGDPVLVPSIANQYVLRRKDGVLVDGKPRGVSARVYQMLARRYGPSDAKYPACDATWLSKSDDGLRNPLAIGQYINNGTAKFPANVAYVEIDLPLATLPLHWYQYVPNAPYAPHAIITGDDARYPRLAGPSYDPLSWDMACLDGRDAGTLPLVALVTTRAVVDGDELLSTYHAVVE